MMEKWPPQRLPREGAPPAIPATPGAPKAPDSGLPGAPVLRSSSFGSVPCAEKDILQGMRDFLALYDGRPIVEQEGGMVSVGLFGVWFMLRAIRPELVIECGVNSGLTTWIIEKALPGAGLVCLDKDLSLLKYKSVKAAYFETGFMEAELVPEGEVAMAIFDDHGDAADRVRKCGDLGIKHILFDDNYPERSGARHRSVAACLGKDARGADGFPDEKAFLMKCVDAYYVFPPVFEHRDPVTMERSVILEPSLLGRFDARRDKDLRVFHQDMPGYRWLTYLRLK